MKKTILSLGILAAIGSTQAFAADTNFYVRGNIGQSSYDIGGGYGNQTDIMVGAALGYTFSPNIGVEAGFNDYGKVNYGGVDGSAKTAQASLILTAPITNEFSVYGRAGVARTERKVSGFGGSVKDDKTEGLFGVGVGYNFAKNLTGTLEYQKLNDSDVSAIAAGVKYSF
jgi:OmpA-OmpF porin, OOP family